MSEYGASGPDWMGENNCLRSEPLNCIEFRSFEMLASERANTAIRDRSVIVGVRREYHCSSVAPSTQSTPDKFRLISINYHEELHAASRGQQSVLKNHRVSQTARGIVSTHFRTLRREA